jgi:histidine triad (HIT) family protein
MENNISYPVYDDCVFCRIIAGDLSPEAVAYHGAETVVFPSLHQRPQNQGHMLVVPVLHIPYIYDVDRDVGGAIVVTVAAVARAIKSIWHADGVVVRQNNEQHGDQDVFHLHFHVIPRFENDGFSRGNNRYPLGSIEVRYEERVQQAKRVHLVLTEDREFKGRIVKKGTGR